MVANGKIYVLLYKFGLHKGLPLGFFSVNLFLKYPYRQHNPQRVHMLQIRNIHLSKPKTYLYLKKNYYESFYPKTSQIAMSGLILALQCFLTH